jgi:hypothetical protein
VTDHIRQLGQDESKNLVNELVGRVFEPSDIPACLSAGMVTSLRSGWTVGIRIPAQATASGPAVGPTQPPILRVLGVTYLGVKWLGGEVDHLPPSDVARSRMIELYLLSHTSSWHTRSG